jgi:hypothetical protein
MNNSSRESEFNKRKEEPEQHEEAIVKQIQDFFISKSGINDFDYSKVEITPETHTLGKQIGINKWELSSNIYKIPNKNSKSGFNFPPDIRIAYGNKVVWIEVKSRNNPAYSFEYEHYEAFKSMSEPTILINSNNYLKFYIKDSTFIKPIIHKDNSTYTHDYYYHGLLIDMFEPKRGSVRMGGKIVQNMGADFSIYRNKMLKLQVICQIIILYFTNKISSIEQGFNLFYEKEF